MVQLADIINNRFRVVGLRLWGVCFSLEMNMLSSCGFSVASCDLTRWWQKKWNCSALWLPAAVSAGSLRGRAGFVYVQEALLRISFYRSCKTQKAPARSSCKQFLHTTTHLGYETRRHNLCFLALNQIGWMECVTLWGTHGIWSILLLSPSFSLIKEQLAMSWFSSLSFIHGKMLTVQNSHSLKESSVFY